MGFTGSLSEIAVLLGCVGSVITNSILLFECELLILEGNNTTGSIGLMKVNPPETDNDECIKIGQDEVNTLVQIDDKVSKCARICSIMALCFGAVFLVLVLFKQYIVPLPYSQYLLDSAATMAQISLALVYVMWRTEACDRYFCSYGEGSTLLILTQIFLMAAGCSTRCMRSGRWERYSNAIFAEQERKKEQIRRKQAEDEVSQQASELKAREVKMATLTEGGGPHEQARPTREREDDLNR